MFLIFSGYMPYIESVGHTQTFIAPRRARSQAWHVWDVAHRLRIYNYKIVLLMVATMTFCSY